LAVGWPTKNALALAAVGVAACFAPAALVALAGAVVVVLVVPSWVTADALVGGDPTADRADWLAASFGGLAVSSAATWIAGATFGLSRATILIAPLVASAAILTTASARDRPPRRGGPVLRALIALSIAFTLLAAIPFYPHGRERADGVHRVGLSDWYLHLMMTSTLDAASALPPPNPYLLAHRTAHYHYGFHLVAAAVHRAADRRGDVFPILLGLTLWTAAAFPLVVFSLSRARLGDSRKALVAAAGGTLLAGFDLVVWAPDVVKTVIEKWPLPHGVAGLRLLIPSAHLHSWIPVYEREFNAPYLAVVWAPHYVAAVLVALLCLHALREAVDRPPYAAEIGRASCRERV